MTCSVAPLLGICLLLSTLGLGEASATQAAEIEGYVSATKATETANRHQEVGHSSLDEVDVVEGHSYLAQGSRRRKPKATRRRRRSAPPQGGLETRVSDLEQKVLELEDHHNRPTPTGPTVSFKGYEYRTMQDGVSEDGNCAADWSLDDSGCKCHSKVWRPMPAGYEVAPNTKEVIKFASKHSWTTHLMVLKSDASGDPFPAYITSGHPGVALEKATPGDKFGASAYAKVNGDQEYYCPWDCYQILIRKKTENRRRKSSVQAQSRHQAPQGINDSRQYIHDVRSVVAEDNWGEDN